MTTYNGWTNRQTWVLKVHDFYEQAFEPKQFKTVQDLADAMGQMFLEFYDENEPKNVLMRDLFTVNIDFRQLAESYKEDFVKEDNDEDDSDE